ncbi:family 16 glycoside hydrolase, partial [Bacteroidota bacterium]
NGGWLNGPQVDIHPPASFRTGLIYDETDGVRRWIYPSLPDWQIAVEQAPESARNTTLLYADEDKEAWNTLEIFCEGMQVETFVNEKRVIDFDAEGILNDEIHTRLNVGTRGIIALQLHSGDELKIRFKDLYIREL